MARDFVTELLSEAEAPSDLRPTGEYFSRGISVAQVACDAWRAEKPRHFMNETAQQKWARIAGAIIAAHEARKEAGE